MSILSIIGAITVGVAAIALALFLLFWVVHLTASAGRAFTKIPEVFWMPSSEDRRHNAAAILTARRVGAISLPFSTVLVWRSNVGWTTNEATRVVNIALRKAIYEAERAKRQDGDV